MKCPHCLNSFHDDTDGFPTSVIKYRKRWWRLLYQECPECGDLIANFYFYYPETEEEGTIAAFPKTSSRLKLPSDLPKEFIDDYHEACLVIGDSPKASAALSRRCLQNILREKANIQIFNEGAGKYEDQKIKKGELSEEIQQVIDHSGLPAEIKEGLNVVRVIGNFAAHPIKSKQTGEIVDVEPGEAEWNLDVLESLFDYYFVQPKVIYQRREILNEKLKAAGKPTIK